jgi:hypothetical protein
MMSDEVKEQVRRAMSKLDPVEMELLKAVLRIEHDNLHLKQPSLKGEILQKVREIVK